MRETFTSGAGGRAPGNRCLYPEPDCLQRSLLRRSRFRQQVSTSVRPILLRCVSSSYDKGVVTRQSPHPEMTKNVSGQGASLAPFRLFS
jgi:hypothetical protein